MGKADLHIHTTYSMDGTATIREVLESARRAGLDVIAITDHDEVRASLEARAICNEYGIQVITGAEISTREGHLIALFIESNIPAGLSLIETLVRIHEADGIAIAVHPDQPIPSSISQQEIRNALEDPQAREALHGIEVYNMNPTHSPFNERSQKAAADLPLARIASSDAHIAVMVGAGVTHFEGSSTHDLRQTIQHRNTRPEQVNHEWPPRIFLRWLRLFLRRKIKDVFSKNKKPQALTSNPIE